MRIKTPSRRAGGHGSQGKATLTNQAPHGPHKALFKTRTFPSSSANGLSKADLLTSPENRKMRQLGALTGIHEPKASMGPHKALCHERAKRASFMPLSDRPSSCLRERALPSGEKDPLPLPNFGLCRSIPKAGNGTISALLALTDCHSHTNRLADRKVRLWAENWPIRAALDY